MDPMQIIQKYYNKNSKAYEILIEHSKEVTKKALQIAKNLGNPKVDLKFVEEAAMLHDIGIFKTNAPDLGCTGDMPYICHGYLGREILEKEGYPKHALVCERHTAVGLTVEDIEKGNLPLPKRDMTAKTAEEEIISYADLFFSKNPKHFGTEKIHREVRKWLSKYGDDKVKIFDSWVKKYEPEKVL